jgi:hypothetical protein
MATYGYSAGYQGGGPQPVAPGFIEGYAQAGRSIGAGIQSIGSAIGGALQRYGEKKAENEFLTQRLESLAPYLQSVAQAGNVMDENSPESKLLGDIEKFSSMSIPQKKATLLNAEFYLDRLDKQKARELQDLQAEAARFNLQTAQDAEARRRGLEQAISQVAQLPATQEVSVPAPPAIISSSMMLPSEQQPYTPFYQVQQIPGAAMQTPPAPQVPQGPTFGGFRFGGSDQYTMGLGRNIMPIPAGTNRAQFTQAPGVQTPPPAGIAPIPQRQAPLFESAPIQRTVTETQPVGYQDRFKQAIDVFQRLGAPINPDAIRSVLEATGTPRPMQIETQTLPGGITVVRADGKVDILPAPKMVEGKDLTEGQANSLGFASRMMLNESTINDVVGRGYRPGGLTEFGFTPERLKTDDRKIYEAAKENWIAAALRKESGAAIGKDEYAAADRQYFPQPGDSDKVLKQKANLRSTVFKSMKAGIGRFADDYLRQIGGMEQTAQPRSALANDPRVASIRARMSSGAITRQQAEQELRALQ